VLVELVLQRVCVDRAREQALRLRFASGRRDFLLRFDLIDFELRFRFHEILLRYGGLLDRVLVVAIVAKVDNR